jgi:flagellar biosynthetic protein FliO
MSAYTSYLLETFVTLLAVCAIAVAVLYGARKMGMGRSTGGIELVGRLPLDSRRSIVLVRVGAQVFLVGVADGGFTKLGELAASDVPSPMPAEPGIGSGTFAAALSRALGKARPAPHAKDTERS